MTFQDFFRREKHVVVNGQPRGFRIIKWIVILTLLAALITWKGIGVALLVFLALCIVGTCAHFFLRWKSDGWTKSWGPYKRITLDGE